jgi:hypothetical protein
MIKIRYADLPAGLHVRAEAHGRSTIIYLLPGLTLVERRSALLRARRSADLGYGPRLPLSGVVAAVTLDRVGALLRNGALALRSHPLLLFPPLIIAMTGSLVYIMLADVTITIRPPQAGGAPALYQAAPPRPTGVPARPGGLGEPPGGGQSPAGDPSRLPHRSRSPRPSRSPKPTRSGAPSPTPSPSPGSPAPQPSPTPSPVPPSPSPSPSPTSSGTCLVIGPLGICLRL